MVVGGVTVDRLAALLVGFGANVQPGQIVVLGSDFGKEELTRAVAERCYQAGAVFVDVQYGDRYLARARVLHGSDDALGYEPGWTLARPRELVEKRGAMIVLSGPVETDVLSGLDPDRLSRDRPPGAGGVDADRDGALGELDGGCLSYARVGGACPSGFRAGRCPGATVGAGGLCLPSGC